MGIDFGYKVYVTKGELATIMGPLAYGAAKRQMRSGTSPLGAVGLDIIEILDEDTGVYLDNPEVVALFDALASAGIISAEVRQKVTDFTIAQLAVPLTPSGQGYAHRYRVPLASLPANPIATIGDYLTAESVAWIEGEYLRIDTDGACTAPDTEVM